MPETPELDEDFYQALRKKIRVWLDKKGKGYRHADVLMLGPDLLHLLSKLALDRRVPPLEKAKIAAAIAYFVSPVDLVPEAAFGAAGLIDDIALAAYVLNGFVNAGFGEIARQHWAGETELLDVIQRVLEVADSALGAGVWRRLRGLVDGLSHRAGDKPAS
jgi:uncharacterized membrane protein YkvA (DUF1232 family)